MAMNYRVEFTENYVSIEHDTGVYLFDKDQYDELRDVLIANPSDGSDVYCHYRLPGWTDGEWDAICKSAADGVLFAMDELELEVN